MLIEIEKDFECPICLEQLEESVILKPCEHKIHKNCLQALVKNSTDPYKCPLCRTNISINETDITIDIIPEPKSDKHRCGNYPEEYRKYNYLIPISTILLISLMGFIYYFNF